MKKFFFILILTSCFLPSSARHVAGGELFYEYLGTNGSSNEYRITLRLFRDCESNGPFLQNELVSVGIYDGINLYGTLPLPLVQNVYTIQMNTAVNPCLIGTVNVCYEVGVYSAITSLPINANGYTLARYGCCRINNITNLGGAGNNVGSTYATFIPGNNAVGIGNHNSSPQFNVKDTALVCAQKNFILDFGATDADADSLTYTFCEGYTAPNGSNNQPPTSTLNLNPLPYSSPFGGSIPLGSDVVINPVTGIISGKAPQQGQYVVCVCITEWRNGVAISLHRKDFILKVQDCDIVDAELPEKITNCKNFTVQLENESPSSAITSYAWNFGDGATSTQPTPLHTYADTGTYKATLFVTGPNGCTGYDSTQVFVYPGFFPAFNYTGACFQTPYQFIDSTKATYGSVKSWQWDFGNLGSVTDTSTQKNPVYQYPSAGNATVQLIVSSSKGCIDTIQKNIVILDKPIIQLPFRDTLICSIDTLQLQANGIGNFSWQNNNSIINTNSASPLVFPKDTTTYVVTLTNSGCVNTDSVKVNVLDFITVSLNDSTICRTDSFRLQPNSYALQYMWSSNTGEILAPVKNPLVQPLTNTMYYVTANLGKCQDRDSAFIKTVPYPKANAGIDAELCYGNRMQLNGTITGNSFTWWPLNSLRNEQTLTPLIGPITSTTYILTVGDTAGCPKKVSDSVFITVIPAVKVNAGSDTAIVINQPLQLMATTNFDNGIVYKWTPFLGLNNPDIANPIALLPNTIDSIKYKVRATIPQGCFGEDELLVKLFKTGPEIFVPSAFTPNNDGKNDIIKPIPVGIKFIEYFRIYNRWGQLVFETNETGKGWNGFIDGKAQPPGTFVFNVQGVDFTGQTIFRKGTVVLLR